MRSGCAADKEMNDELNDAPDGALPAPDDDDAADDGKPETREPAARVRGRRRQLRVAAAEELADWRHLDADDVVHGVDVVLTGQEIHGQRAAMSKIGAAIEHLANLYRDLGGGTPYISNFAFGNSVRITIEPSRTEASRARAALENARELRASGAPREDVDAALRAAVSDVEIAAVLAADILSAPIDETPLRVAELGQDVAVTTRSLAVALAREHVSVSLAVPGKPERTNLSAARAQRVADVLREVQEPTSFEIEAPGVLSMADALHRQFALSLAANWERPEELKGKRVIRGEYDVAVGEMIRDRSFWGNRVVATIHVTRDAVISSARLRPPAFRLVDVSSPPD